MFDLISQSMLFLLETLKSIVGNYGWAIIALTVIVRAALWPVSRSQMRSMKMMQDLQPKMKMLQERYKTDPQQLQSEMMKLYKDHKFNPLGGCLPMLVQLPLFIGLYWAISNPHFMAGGDPMFYNVHLNHTGIISHAGASEDGVMNLGENPEGGFLGTGKDALVALPQFKVVKTDGTELDLKLPDANKALTLPKKIHPGIPITVKTNLDRLGMEGYEGYVKTITVTVVNNGTKELETVTFMPQDKSTRLESTLNTALGKTVPHLDVLILVILFATTMIWSQKMMASQTQSTANAQQQQMMKMMPIMFSVMLFLFPIPAGVLLYMDTNSLFQIFQTWMFNREGGLGLPTNSPPSQTVLDIKPET